MENEKRLIDADKEIEAIKKYACDDCESYDGIKCRSCWADDLISWIEDAPKVDAMEVVHGRWEDVKETALPYDPHTGFATTHTAETCSVCNVRTGFIGSKAYLYDNYCPNCGAKMDGDGNG